MCNTPGYSIKYWVLQKGVGSEEERGGNGIEYNRPLAVRHNFFSSNSQKTCLRFITVIFFMYKEAGE